VELRTTPATRLARRSGRGLRPYGFAFRLAGCALCVSLAAVLAGTIAQANLIWVANGVLLAYLLLVPRRLWPAYLGAGLLGYIAGAIIVHTPWQVSLVDTPFDLLEAFLGALLLRRRSAQLPRFTQIKYVLRFIAFAVLVAPLTAGFLAALVLSFWQHTAFFRYFIEWVAAGSLGACVVTPACIAIFRARILRSLGSGRIWAHLLPLAAVTFVVLGQAKAPLPFLLFPLLILILLRLGRGWAATATLFVGAVGIWYTVHGEGPFAAAVPLSRLEPAIILQLFIVSAMVMLYSVSDVIENLLSTERKLQEIAALHKLVTENSRDIIIVADFEGHRSLVSAAGATWSGWSQEEMLQLHSLALVHPADQPMMAQSISELRAGKEDALVECRVRKQDGSYVWVEASLRTIRDPRTGVPTGILNTVREITQRKLAEQQLAEAYHAVEALAITDALTGLANRRRFDQYLTTEWRRGMRERSPLSLVLIDADQFKSYNDTYGHLRGDNCLKQIAEAIQDVVSRPGDLVARFGGEEFAVVLPNTDAPGALHVAQEICAVMRNRELPHSSNPVGVVTISAGCATLVPQLGQHAPSLIDCADQALYGAKRNGRNGACAYPPGTADRSAAAIGPDLIALKSA
jgi:diguanylate cyclase (GGDEF)-like protein/PAS domain S-box-containing protein